MTSSLIFCVWPVTKSYSYICGTKFWLCIICTNCIECNNFIISNILPWRTICCILNLVFIVSKFLNWIKLLNIRPWTSWFTFNNTNYIRWYISIYLLDYIWSVYFCTICRQINLITYSSILISNPNLNCCCLWRSIIYFNFLFSIFSTSFISYTNNYFTLFKCCDITVLIYCCNCFIWTCPYQTFICCFIRFYSCIQLNSFFW